MAPQEITSRTERTFCPAKICGAWQKRLQRKIVQAYELGSPGFARRVNKTCRPRQVPSLQVSAITRVAAADSPTGAPRPFRPCKSFSNKAGSPRARLITSSHRESRRGEMADARDLEY